MTQSGPVGKSRSIYSSFRYATYGLVSALASERNLRIHWTASVLLCVFNILVRPTLGVVCLGLAICCAVIAMEMVNTAVERVVDLAVGSSWHPLAKAAKDVSAGAVLAMSAMALIFGYFVASTTYPWRVVGLSTFGLEGLIVSAVYLIIMLVWGFAGLRAHSRRRKDESVD